MTLRITPSTRQGPQAQTVGCAARGTSTNPRFQPQTRSSAVRFLAAHSSSPQCKGGWGTPMGGRWGKGAEAISGIPGASRATSWACLDSHPLSNTRGGWYLPVAAPPSPFLLRSQTQGLQKGQSSPWTQSTDRATAGQVKARARKNALRV